MRTTLHWVNGVSLTFLLGCGATSTAARSNSIPGRPYFISLPQELLLCADGVLPHGSRITQCLPADILSPPGSMDSTGRGSWSITDA